MECRLIALDMNHWVSPVGIGETLRQAVANLVMRLAGDRAKTECGSLQLCEGLDAGIERGNQVVAQRQRERHVLDPGSGADEGSEVAEDESAVITSGTEREGEEVRVRVI